MSDSHIVQATIGHSEIIATLHDLSCPKPWSSDEFTTLLTQPGVAAWLGVNDEPAGFILVRAAADEAEILTFAVAPDHRRRGLGKLLLAAACTALRAAGTNRFFLEVAADNAAAIALYHQLGFEPCGTRRAYYHAADKTADAVVMALAL